MRLKLDNFKVLLIPGNMIRRGHHKRQFYFKIRLQLEIHQADKLVESHYKEAISFQKVADSNLASFQRLIDIAQI